MHQVAAVLGVGILAASGISGLFHMFVLLGWHIPLDTEYLVFTGNSFYPIQVICGFFLGWSLGKRLPHPYMAWVWLLPFTMLCYFFITASVLIPEWTSILTRPNSIHSRLAYYFSSGCQPSAHCLDQLLITMPFYTSVAYSFGAKLSRQWVKQHITQKPEANSR